MANERDQAHCGNVFWRWLRICEYGKITNLQELTHRQAEEIDALSYRPSPLRLNIKIRPGAIGTCRADQVRLEVSSPSVVAGDDNFNANQIFLTDVQRQLRDAGISWGAELDRARFLFRGVELKSDKPLLEQGLRDGAELLVVKAMATPTRPRSAGPCPAVSTQIWRASRFLKGNGIDEGSGHPVMDLQAYRPSSAPTSWAGSIWRRDK
jgi:hypothetical protein